MVKERAMTSNSSENIIQDIFAASAPYILVYKCNKTYRLFYNKKAFELKKTWNNIVDICF